MVKKQPNEPENQLARSYGKTTCDNAAAKWYRPILASYFWGGSKRRRKPSWNKQLSMERNGGRRSFEEADGHRWPGGLQRASQSSTIFELCPSSALLLRSSGTRRRWRRRQAAGRCGFSVSAPTPGNGPGGRPVRRPSRSTAASGRFGRGWKWRSNPLPPLWHSRRSRGPGRRNG